MRLSIAIIKGILAGALLFPVSLCLVAAPVSAQESAETLIAAVDEKIEMEDMRQWFESLPAEKKQVLQRRSRALRGLSKDKQEAILSALKGDKDVFSPGQKEALKKIAALSPLQRLRLHGLRMEVEQIRKVSPEFFKGLEGMSRSERVAAWSRKVSQLRANRFVNGLDEKTREELKALPDAERIRKGREMFVNAARERLEALAKGQPQLAELRAKAEGGDKEAKRKLAQMMRDLGTLDKLIERLEESKRAGIRAKVTAMPIDEAVRLVKDELGRDFKGRPKRDGPREKDGRDAKDESRHRPPRDEFRDREKR
ncbi:MAG: hypothetical protein IT462_00475 [Planctomycetes bacterium]|nr:hypothetical protein [Planctomycetota bacterium]